MNGKFSGNNSVFRRRGDRERLLFFAAAGLACSLLVIMAVVLNYKTDASARSDMAPRASDALPQQVGSVTLFAPDKNIPSGTKLSDTSFREVYWPRHQVPEGAVMDKAEIRGKFAKVNLPAGMPIQKSSLTAEALSVSLPLTPGNRAISIGVDATSSLEGHALPGTRVDVVLTFYENSALTTKVIVQNARVLSAGGDMKSASERSPIERTSPSKTITLDVSPSDALKIQTANQLGKISLIMRSSEDDKTTAITEMSQNDLGDPSAKKKPVEKDAKACNKGKVRIGSTEYLVGCDGAIRQVEEQQN